MKVKKISSANVEACSLPKLFDEEKIDFQSEKKVYVPSMEKTMDLYGLIPVWSFSLFRPVTESIII